MLLGIINNRAEVIINLLGYKKNKKIAFCLGDGCGLGNFVQALSAIQALYEAGNIIDVFISGHNYSDMTELVKGQPYIRSIYENTYYNSENIYDFCIVSFLSNDRVSNAKKYIILTTDWHRRSEYEQYCWWAEKLGAGELKPPSLSLSNKEFYVKSFNLLIHAGCSQRKYWERKKWLHYDALADLMRRDGFTLYCCGREDEVIHHPWVTPFNHLTITETAALIHHCDLFISNDSGLMHVAAALRKKQIAIFTATSNRKSAPGYNPHARVLIPELKCYPCQGDDKRWNACREWICQRAISAETVYLLVKKMLGYTEPDCDSCHG